MKHEYKIRAQKRNGEFIGTVIWHEGNKFLYSQSTKIRRLAANDAMEDAKKLAILHSAIKYK